MRATFQILIAACFCAGQSFEVASIKPSGEMGRGMSIGRAPGGIFSATNASLKDLLMFAYDVRPFQIVGGPSWAESAAFNVIAKPESGEPRVDQLRAMVQKLLTDRFELMVHRETKEMPVYALAVGRGGARLRASTKDNMSISGGRGQMIYSKVQMALFAQNLSMRVGKMVLDKTGLAGDYDFTLQWTEAEVSDGTGPSLFTSLQEQLGLKLEATKGPVEVVVIDRAAKPSEN